MKTVMHVAQAAGGVERYLYTLLKYLDKNEYNNILVLSQSYDLEKFKEFASQIECVEMHREIGFASEIKVIFNIRKLIKKYHPDILYVHSSKAGATARLANLGLKNVCIYNAHGWAFNMKISSKKTRIYELIERILAPLCTKIICISDFEKESAVKRHICKPDKIQVIYNGIDFDEHKADQNWSKVELGIPEDAYVVGMVGRLEKQKAPDVFVRTAKLIKEKIPNAFFVMVGEGNEEKKTKELISSFNLTDRFLITGWVNNPLDYIRCFNVAMLLSRWEGFGLVLPEYMLEGKPVVATRVDAIPNIITNGENGILVEMDDDKGAAEAVEKIYSTSIADELVKNGLICVKERFNAERVARDTENLFKKLSK